MKRKLFLAILAAACLVVFNSCGYIKLERVFNNDTVTAATVIAADAKCNISDGNTLATLARIVNSGLQVSVDTLGVSSPVFKISAIDNNGSTQVFSVYDFLQSSDYAYVLSKDGNYYEVDKKALFNLLSGDGFDDLYTALQFPTTTIVADDKRGALVASEYNWSYKKLDGNFYDAPASEPVEAYKYVLTTPDAPKITFSIEPTTTDVTVIHNDKTVFVGSIKDLPAFRMSSGGRYEYEINAAWSEASLTDYNGNAVYRFCVDYNPPASFEISATSSDPGETLVIYARGLENEEITITSPFKYEPQFFDYDGMKICLFPLSYLNEIGSYTLELSAKSAYAKYEISLKDKKFEIQKLTVDEDTTASTINNDEANAEFDKVIQPLKAIRDEQKYFEGKFIRPAEGEITTQFGMIRYINGSASSERHSGIDIAAKRGTKVMASNAGRVIYAGKLKLTGNTVLIEHGFGLKTWYYHMDSLTVKTDTMVKQGDTIGTVGSTGFSTGPHLHFAMSVNGVFINPDTAIDHVLID